MTTLLLILMSLFFIGYSLFLYKGIRKKDGLRLLRSKLTLGIILLYVLFVGALTLIYINLVGEGYSFKTVYSTKINAKTHSVLVGTDENCDIQIFNAFSDSEHVVFDFSKDPMVQILTKERSAIVNNTLLTLKKPKDKNVSIVKDGDVLRIDGIEYRLGYDDVNLSLTKLSPMLKLWRIEGKKYQTRFKVGDEIEVGKGKHKSLSIDGNTTIRFYMQEQTKNPRIFMTLVEGNDVFVNKHKLTLTHKPNIEEIQIKDGDIMRLGYSDYKIHFTATELELHNMFFTPSVVNLFNIYATTTMPNLTKNADAGTVSLWWIYLMTVLVVLVVVIGILALNNALTQRFALMGDNRFILYPVLYFSFFLSFLLFVSMINFTVLQYYQFSVYNKGALYTVLLVYVMMMFSMFLAWLGYKKKLVFTLMAFLLVAGVIIVPWFYESYIFTSIYKFGLNKTIFMTSLDLGFIFVIFGFGFGRLIRNLLDAPRGLFYEKQVNINLLIKLMGWTIIAGIFGLGMSFAMSEGAGIVVIETIKLFIFFVFTIVLLDDFDNKKKKGVLGFWMGMAFVPLLMAIVMGLKDMGSLIQVALAIGMIALFFYNRLKEINFFNKTSMAVMGVFLVIAIFLAAMKIHDNIRLDMWVEPFAQTLEVENKFFMYYYDQIARGLYLVKQASFLPNDFMKETFVILPNLHTDFIFTMFVNVFGLLGFVAIIVAFIVTMFSFSESIHAFQNSRRDVYRFIYGVNVIFVVYIFSYIIINMLSVLQVFPLTDVPFPIFTYARGVTILFFVLYVFVAVVNYLYLDFVSHKSKGKFRGRV